MQHVEYKGVMFSVNSDATRVTAKAKATDGTDITVTGKAPGGGKQLWRLGDTLEELHQHLLFKIRELGGDYDLTSANAPIRAREHKGGVIIYWRGIKNPQRYRGCYYLDITGGKFECITATPRLDGYASADMLAAALEREALAKLHQR